MEPLFLVREMFPFGQEVCESWRLEDGYYMWVANDIQEDF